MRLRRAAVLLFALASSSALGCADIAGPQWFAPGSSQEQQRRAQWFDPYPAPNVGPSDSTTRPLGYQSPPPEADRRVRTTRAAPGRW